MKRLCYLALLTVGACFDPSQPTCTYTCGPNSECPDNYMCNTTDHYCHRLDKLTAACDFPDAATIDQSIPDLNGVDGHPDQNVTDLGSDI